MATTTVYHRFDFGESWITKNWRPIAAIVYLIICLTDFVGMPIYYEWVNHKYSPEQIINLVMKLPPAAQIDALKVLMTQNTWAPLTLMGSGMFHIAFGAILGVAAWTRGGTKQAQYAAAINSIQNGNSPDTPPPSTS